MESKKRGRPVKDITRSNFARLRLNSSEYEMLEELQSLTGMSKSNILRGALRVYYHNIVGERR